MPPRFASFGGRHLVLIDDAVESSVEFCMPHPHHGIRAVLVPPCKKMRSPDVADNFVCRRTHSLSERISLV